MGNNSPATLESLERIFGDLSPLRKASVAVVGLGGVGSWAAESLARSGVGKLTLMDLDEICMSNINRQVHALCSTVGQLKTSVLRARLQDIQPAMQIEVLADFYDSTSSEKFWSQEYSAVIDATDSLAAKESLVVESLARRVPLLVCGAAGGRTEIDYCIADLGLTRNDPLLAKLRSQLRQSNSEKFPKGQQMAIGVEAIACRSAANTIRRSAVISSCSIGVEERPAITGRLDCAGSLGSYVGVTAGMGLRAADWAIKRIYRDAP